MAWRSAQRAAAIAGLAVLPAASAGEAAPKRCAVAAAEFQIEAAPGVDIAGVVERPARDAGVAILLLHGDGPHDRDQTISGSPMFAQISTFFTARGATVIRFDRRGHGRSTGTDYEQHTTADNAADASAVLAALRSENKLKDARIVLMGHSEGAMSAAIMAAADPSIALAAMIGPPGLSGAETWASQFRDNLLRRGASEDVAEAVRVQFIRYAAYIARGPHAEDDPEFAAIGHDLLAAHGMAEADITPELAAQFFGGFRTPWYRFFLGHDIADDLKRMTQPVIAAFAGADENVPPARHLPPFAAALAGHDDASFAILPDEDHFFLRHDGARLEKHAFGEMEVSPALLDYLAGQLRRHAPLREPCAP